MSGTSSSIRTKLWWNSHWMVLFQNCVRQSRSPTTVQLRCYWKQLWSRWAITGSWEPLVYICRHFCGNGRKGFFFFIVIKNFVVIVQANLSFFFIIVTDMNNDNKTYFSTSEFYSQCNYILYHTLLTSMSFHFKLYLWRFFFQLSFMAILMVETDIITSITASPNSETSGNIMYVENFKTEVIVFISNVIMCLTSHWLIMCLTSQWLMFDVTLTDNF